MAQPNKMLIDATHPEETRVVVLRNGRVEEFDYESAARKLLRGNIYLAKVTRVEPALQAAFVDYGGNRHGFLAFNEIHPDYYQIPVADRQALLDEEAAIEAEEEAEVDARAERMANRRSRGRRPRRGGRDAKPRNKDQASESDTDEELFAETDDSASREDRNETAGADSADDHAAEPASVEARDSSPEPQSDSDADNEERADTPDTGPAADESEGDANGEPPKTIPQATEKDPTISADPDQFTTSSGPASELDDGAPDVENLFLDEVPNEDTDANPDDADHNPDETPAEIEAREKRDDDEVSPDDDDADDDSDGDDNGDDDEQPEEVDTEEDALEEATVRPRRTRRSYKIQEVIKRRQVLLIQVVKEERGNKGAALTTYLSLAGRYTVLMPNTARGGGISRKITTPADRKRLKAIAQELEVPEGMGLIIRTAGASRTKQEIQRDFEYLLRLWESVRELTLESTAPTLVYEEGNLIKRSIRDLYNKDVDEVVVAGDEACNEAKAFMGMLMPSHAKNVVAYRTPEPLFTRYQIEPQLNAMFSPQVTLKSGGYLVINQTEALVAVDVNSGRSTREFSIEETALHTNLEAADELARQLKLRDLAGLIVVDFIDMEEKKNNRAVERRLKEALKHDRARIQIGRISHFGLLEMSRQRMRTGVLEGSTQQCVHCQGSGIIRSTESIALAVLRGLDEAVNSRQRGPLCATTTATVALYILNNKRDYVIEMENRYGFPISIEASEKMVGANFTIERAPASAPTAAVSPLRRADRSAVSMDSGFETAGVEDEEADDDSVTARDGSDNEQRSSDDNGRRRRRRRRRGGRSSGPGEDNAQTENQSGADESSEDQPDVEISAANEGSSQGNNEGDDEEGRVRGRRGRRRGRRGGRRNRERQAQRTDENGNELPPGLGPQPSIAANVVEITEGEASGDAAETQSQDTSAGENGEESTRPRGRRRRDRSGGSKDRNRPEEAHDGDNGTARAPETQPEPLDDKTNDSAGEPAPAAAHKPDVSSQPDAVNTTAEVAAAEASGSNRAARTDPVHDTPRVERISVGAETGDKEEAEAEEGRPTRRGWWQRRILGE